MRLIRSMFIRHNKDKNFVLFYIKCYRKPAKFYLVVYPKEESSVEKILLIFSHKLKCCFVLCNKVYLPKHQKKNKGKL